MSTASDDHQLMLNSPYVGNFLFLVSPRSEACNTEINTKQNQNNKRIFKFLARPISDFKMSGSDLLH